MNGLVIMTVPKSGTMFLSHYLRELTGYNYRFGYAALGNKPLPRQIANLYDTPKDKIRARIGRKITVVGGPMRLDPEPHTQMPRSQHMSPHKWEIIHKDKWIVVDHAVSINGIFGNPSHASIVHPSVVVNKATKEDFGVLFLYRDLRDTLNSLAHFLRQRVKKNGLQKTIQFTIDNHAPIFAELIRMWKSDFRDGLTITYKSLHENTFQTLSKICHTYGLPCRSKIISSMDEYKSWTYRKGGSGDWQNNFTKVQGEYILNEYPDLCSD